MNCKKVLYASLVFLLIISMTACGIKMGKIDVSFGQKSSRSSPTSEVEPIASPVPSPQESAKVIPGGARMVNY